MTKPTLPPWATYPCPSIGKYQRLVNPASLPTDQKQRLWAAIKAKNPDLAALLRNDANVAILKEKFGAVLVFTDEQINGFIGGGSQP